MVAEKKTATTPRRKKVPDYLVREMIDGQPLYYKGYKDVLRKKKTPERLLPSTLLQSFILSYLVEVAIEGKLKYKYEMLTGNIALGENRNSIIADLVLYKSFVFVLKKTPFSLADMVPVTAVCIDTKVEVANDVQYKYISDKIKAMLCLGIEKTVYIFTTSWQVIIALPDQPWSIYDWNESIELMDGVAFNIGEYLKKKGIQVPDWFIDHSSLTIH